MKIKFVISLLASTLFIPGLANAACLAGVPAYLCASYDFNLPVNITSTAGPIPAFTVMGGDVGIGTLAPDSPLTVAGTVHLTSGAIQFPDGTVQSTSATGSGLGSQWSSAGFDISYSVGNVGVGTASPDSPLTVAGLIHTTSGGIKFPDGSIQTIAATSAAPSQWTTSGANIYYTSSAPGNVGIGTSSPAQKLSVAGVIESTTGGVKFPDGTVQTTAGGGGSSQWQTNTNGISYSGNVGLGTTNPSSALAIVNAGTAMGSGVFYNFLQRSPGAFGTLLGYDSTNSAGIIASSSTTPGGLEFLTYSGSFQKRMRITAAGDVGIGTLTPASKLSVAGVVESTTGGFKFPDGTTQTTAASGSGGSSQWTTSGSDISYSTGSVGIGTTTPDSPLTVAGLIHTTFGGVQFPDGTVQASAAYNLPPQWTPTGTDISYSAGNVGVGTLTPDSPLTVVGDIHVTFGALKFADGTTQSTAATSGVSSQWTTTGSNIYYTTGSVGVGTSTPASPLTVAGIIQSTSGGIKFPDGTVQATASTSGTSQWTTSGSDIYYAPGGGGNVGIGAQASTSPLQVDASTNVYVSRFAQRSNDANGAYIGIEKSRAGGSVVSGDDVGGLAALSFDGTSNVSGARIKFQTEGTVASGSVPTNIQLHTGTSGGGVERMRIASNGNVGIGTSTPAQHLEVYSASTNYIAMNGPNTSNNGVGFQEAGTWKSVLQWIGTGSGVSGRSGNVELVNFAAGALSLWTNNANRFHIDSVGSVGIGTTTPSYKLDVNGTIRGYSITDSSDVRLKKDIYPLKAELTKILKLRAVSYNWNDQMRDPSKQIGLIAQEVEKVYPELVKTDEQGMKSVNYSHLVAPLAQAVKELSAQNAELMVRLERLEKRMESKQ